MRVALGGVNIFFVHEIVGEVWSQVKFICLNEISYIFTHNMMVFVKNVRNVVSHKVIQCSTRLYINDILWRQGNGNRWIVA